MQDTYTSCWYQNDQNSSMEEEIAAMFDANRRESDIISSLALQIDLVLEPLAEASESASRSQAVTTTLGHAFEQFRHTIAALDQKLQQAERGISSLEEQARQDIAALKCIERRLMDENKALQANIRELEATLEQAEKRHESKVCCFEQEFEAVKQELCEQSAQHCEQLQQHEEARRTLCLENSKLLESSYTAVRQLQLASSELLSLRSTFGHRLKILGDQVEHFQIQATALDHQVAEQQQQQATTQRALEESKGEQLTLQNQCNELKKALESSALESFEAQKQCNELQISGSRLLADLQSSRECYGRLEAEVDGLQVPRLPLLPVPPNLKP
eukprot:1480347-Rhodomonas_salina.2